MYSVLNKKVGLTIFVQFKSFNTNPLLSHDSKSSVVLKEDVDIPFDDVVVLFNFFSGLNIMKKARERSK